jgi:hypothetical protein
MVAIRRSYVTAFRAVVQLVESARWKRKVVTTAVTIVR